MQLTKLAPEWIAVKDIGQVGRFVKVNPQVPSTTVAAKVKAV